MVYLQGWVPREKHGEVGLFAARTAGVDSTYLHATSFPGSTSHGMMSKTF
jgi:hypothetical protein